MIKTREEIELQIVAEVVANQDEITVFEPRSAMRGIITAFAGVIRELWNDLYMVYRKIFLNTTTGSDLDDYASTKGLSRLGPISAAVLLTFTGTNGTLIPKGTRIPNLSTGIGYITQDDLTIGSTNPVLLVSNLSEVTDPSISDTVWAYCEQAGSIGNCQIGTITGIPPIAGISQVINLSPAQGGMDLESDQIFRNRIRNYISILNQDTAAKFEALCQKFDSRILRVKVKKDYTMPYAIRIIIVTLNGLPLSKNDLSNIASQLTGFTSAYITITCENIQFTIVTAKERFILAPGFAFNDVFVNTANAEANYFNWQQWPWGQEIEVDKVFSISDGVKGKLSVELNTFQINATNPANASTTQTLYNQVCTSATVNSITDSSANYPVNSLTGRYVRILTGTQAGQTRQILDNTAQQITIIGTWTAPLAGALFTVIEIYVLSLKSQIAINEDSLPYYWGLEMTDISNPNSLVVKKANQINQRQFRQINNNQTQN